LRRFATYIEGIEPEAIDKDVPEADIVNRFILPLPDGSIRSFFEESIYYVDEEEDDGEGDLAVKSASHVECKLLNFHTHNLRFISEP
jgi:hypothetical protein